MSAAPVDQRWRWKRYCAGHLLGCAAVLAQAQPVGFDAQQWLARAQAAATQRSYQGTMTSSGGGHLSSSRISRVSDGRQRLERIELLNGQARQQLRHNETVLTLWPQTRVAVFETEDAVAEFPALPSLGQRLLESYEARPLGQDRVAGMDVDVVVFKPKDGMRYAQRLWAERGSGLLLRADVLGPRGEVLESSAFTELSFGGKLQPDSVLGPMKRLDGYRVLRLPSQRVNFESEGWTMQRAVAGFHLVGCARRALEASMGVGDARQVLQAVYSDGLTHVSVFVEPFDAQQHRPMRTSLGATSTLMNRQGEWWITVVGDVPMPTIQQFEAGLQRR
ncbi:MucB/RseB C-terminal domain-containing protein [Ideonella sp. A 288]|uniref:MucB/RseB C-terminal domain-containing protein n=1 Tax=Ideonella sp. A 288 TaxID=1962181 RepID=UPI000B4AB53A|nr:MucB/RseB C-terminal domain-containing protein [Ideonella sp. A 288]